MAQQVLLHRRLQASARKLDYADHAIRLAEATGVLLFWVKQEVEQSALDGWYQRDLAGLLLDLHHLLREAEADSASSACLLLEVSEVILDGLVALQ